MVAWLCCFCRQRSPPSTTPDERTYLIPTEPQPANINDETVRRQRALQSRLTSIVRAKEGKMVNLHARLPFNLHNRNLSACLDPSTSRSASDSLLTSPASPRYPISYPVNSPSNFHDAKDDYPSRSSSVVPPQRGRGYEGEPDWSSDREEESRAPILNLRLVNPKYGIGMGRPLTRGRSQLKLAGQGAQAGEETARETSLGEDVQGETNTISPVPQEQEVVVSPADTVVPKNPPFTSDVQIAVSPASTSSFKIQETTPLVLAWDS
ncbi:hypothetical protein AGABI1DRAFT_132423 [Agaricus bisporus var. burnettii JB137-S8]|uniref:Uncharacterized protein n=1 Tax=Agaricus bisporus var. burnettii (strain JB137-S8 / ATCC MYA-4627 / FGSC 10392) TaxID=597362 RepID=K5WJ22_AGABU|nr:uncharacterized protein AGABI1DRAFT_132423 [Agaricus bisporus var. burnettii JB137-S8]EKM75286.1 hypothetical protein AGABI1DRAFT_132423 [Agaricus bisporus var. burnettii JB137-S8]